MNIMRKIARACYYGTLTWAVTLILCGLPLLNKISEIWPWITMMAVAVIVESLFGTSPRIILELAIDMGVGAIGVMIAKFSVEVPFYQNLASQFSIPRMSALIIYIVVAFTAQLEVRSKRERREHRSRRRETEE